LIHLSHLEARHWNELEEQRKKANGRAVKSIHIGIQSGIWKRRHLLGAVSWLYSTAAHGMDQLAVGDSKIPLNVLAAPNPMLDMSCQEISVDEAIVLSELLMLSSNGLHSLELRGNSIAGVCVEIDEGEEEDAASPTPDLAGIESLLTSIVSIASLTYLGLSNGFLGAESLRMCAGGPLSNTPCALDLPTQSLNAHRLQKHSPSSLSSLWTYLPTRLQRAVMQQALCLDRGHQRIPGR
jgi:hypothetical protein